MKVLRNVLLFISALGFSQAAWADIEPVNIVTVNGVGIPAALESLYEKYDKYTNQLNDIKTTFGDMKNKVGKFKEVVTNPMVIVPSFGLIDKRPENRFEAVDNTKKTYSSTEGGADRIEKDRELYKALNEIKFKNLSTLFAVSIIKRRQLLKEETKKPDLSTLLAAQKAINDMLIQSSKRWATILQTQAFVKEFKYTVDIQNYDNSVEEDDEK